MCLGDMCEGLTCAGQQTGGRVDQAGDDCVSREEIEGRWQVMEGDVSESKEDKKRR